MSSTIYLKVAVPAPLPRLFDYLPAALHHPFDQ
jgi:hypothetical protein